MDIKSVFNATICLLSIIILIIHAVNIIVKKHKRKDDKAILTFILFTVFHFSIYLIFTFIKQYFVSNIYTMTFYTLFYIMNNIEAFLFYNYMRSYVEIDYKLKKKIDILNIILFLVFVLSDIVNIFTKMYFSAADGIYKRSKFMILSQGYQFIILLISLAIVLKNKQLTNREKIAFYLFCLLPLLSIIIQNLMPGYAIAYATLFISIEILFLFTSVEKNIKIQEDEKLLKEARVRIMVSQIRPHFVYNTLSSISTLISINPKDAQKALDDFTEYLRVNFSSLTETKLVPFDYELKHIKTYVDLEKMRFKERINVIYEINESNFLVPPLSIQPLVENAIKHGILKKVEGGTIILKTYKKENYYSVEVIDDGIGFDFNKVDFKNNEHIGISNVQYRIKSMTKGDIKFFTSPNNGTKVEIRFYK